MVRRLTGSYRARLFLAMLLLGVAVVATLALYAQTTVRTHMRARLNEELERHVAAASVVLQAKRPPVSLVDFDRLADETGNAIGVRVTFVNADGRVLGDSRLDLAEIRQVGDHSDRPEIIAALANGKGRARRFSVPMGEEMVYAAATVPYDAPDGTVPTIIARVSLPAKTADAPIDELTRALWVAAVLASALAAGLAGWLSFALSSKFRELVQQVRDAAGIDAGELPSDEIEHVAGSFGRLAEELEATVGTLATERDRFGVVLDSLGEAVLAVDSKWRIETINASAKAMFVVSDEVRGRAVIDLARVPALSEWMETDGTQHYASTEFELGGPRGHRTVTAECFPRRSGRGAVLVFRDVTELRHLETMRRDFVANVSHELRTPIAIVLAAAETLASTMDELPLGLDKFVEKIQRNATRLGRLVNDLLDLSRLEAQRAGLESARVDLRTTAQTVLTALGPTAAKAGAEFELRVPEHILVMGDGRAIEQIWTNLAENALKYAGGHIVLWAEHRGGRVRFGVDDEGPGIPQSHHARLFERFYRVDPGRSRDAGGTGLGLSIVKHLAEAMGGTVGVESRPTGGTRFWGELPPVS